MLQLIFIIILILTSLILSIYSLLKSKNSPSSGSPSGPSYDWPPGDSKCIQGIVSNVCFSPYQHILGSTTLQDAVEKEIQSGSNSGKKIKQLRDNGSEVLFGVGSAGVANNVEWDSNNNKWNNGWTSNNNGSCYQIRFNPENIENKKVDLILQSINTGLPNAFDVYLPLGGAGAFNNSPTCSYVWGSNDKIDWSKHIQDTEICSDTKGPNPKKTPEKACNDYFKDNINPIFGEKSKESFIKSCIKSVETRVACPYNDKTQGVVEHPGSIWKRVECPKELTEVSGLRIKKFASNLGSKPEIQQIDTDAGNMSIDNTGFYSTSDWSANGDNAFNLTNDDLGSGWGPTSSWYITQMQDCRSPDASQCFKLPKGTQVDTGREAAFNINTDGTPITRAGFKGCHNLPYVGNNRVNDRVKDNKESYGKDFNNIIDSSTNKFSSMDTKLKGNWNNNIGDVKYTENEPYLKGLCPIAFPPGEDSCIMYQNNNNCANMKIQSDHSTSVPNHCIPENPITHTYNLDNMRLNNKDCWKKSNELQDSLSCGKVTVKKNSDYESDKTTGITLPQSFNKCSITYNPDEFNVNGNVWETCSTDIKKRN